MLLRAVHHANRLHGGGGLACARSERSPIGGVFTTHARPVVPFSIRSPRTEHLQGALASIARLPCLVIMASGVEIIAVVLHVAGSLAKSVGIVHSLPTRRLLSAENKYLCDAVARQLEKLRAHVEKMQSTQVQDL